MTNPSSPAPELVLTELALSPEEVSQVADRLLEGFLAWQRAERPRESFTAEVLTVPRTRGAVIRALIARLLAEVAPGQRPPAPDREVAAGQESDRKENRQDNAAAWREELFSSRARTWGYPDGAGMLVGPSVIILTDGRQGLALHEGGRVRALPVTTSASLMLLSETIVMAQNALSAREVEQLQRQRIDANSSSLSAVDPIR